VSIRRITLLRCDPEAGNVYSGFSHPGLALPLIGTVLQQAGFDCAIFVDAIRRPSEAELAGADLFAFTVNSACFQESYRLGDRLRRDTGATIVYGGPHVTFMAEEALQHGDFVVRGEGERTIVELVRALDRGATDFDTIRGVSWRDRQGRIHHNPERPLDPDIDIIPDQSLIAGYREFNRRAAQRVLPTGMLVSSSRGCPFRCTFCTIPQTTGTTMRYRSHESLIADIRQQIAFAGHRYIYFADDNFTAHRKHAKALLKALIEADVRIRFSAQVRVDTTEDPELVDLLRDAGCYLVFVGMESLNDASLKAFKKGRQTRVMIERAVEEFHRRRIMVHGMFVIGADDDGPGTAVRTAGWAIDQGIASLQMLPVCPLPGTEILGQLEAAERVYKRWHQEWRYEYIPYGAGNFVVIEPAQMTALQLQEELLDAYERFYSWRHAGDALGDVPRNGLEPLIFRLMGKQIIRHTRPEIEAHMRWLEEHPKKRRTTPPWISLRSSRQSSSISR
jgi:radical SAM superfamily enzyme YgiQ (UPF0313 family)